MSVLLGTIPGAMTECQWRVLVTRASDECYIDECSCMTSMFAEKAKQNDDRHTQKHTNGEFHTKRIVSPHETSWDTDADRPAPKNDLLLDVYMRNTFLRQSPSSSINFDTRKNNGKQNDERHTYTHTHQS